MLCKQTIALKLTILGVMLSACTQKTQAIKERPTTASSQILKLAIFYQDSDSNWVAAEDLNLATGKTTTFKAVIVNQKGQIIEEAIVSWFLTNPAFPSSNLSTLKGSSVNFTPSVAGTTALQATYVGKEQIIETGFASTGTLTIAGGDSIAASDTKAAFISIESGNEQSSAVGELLPLPLQVVVKNDLGRVISGLSIKCSIIEGQGAEVVGDHIVQTNEQGLASCQFKAATTAGVNTFRMSVVDEPTLYKDFTATSVAGALASLAFTVQPGNAFATASFGTQPVVSFYDIYGNLTSVQGNVSLSVSTGSGSLIGTTTVLAQGSSVAFKTVGYDTNETGVVLKASFGTLSALSEAFNVQAPPPGACVNNSEPQYFTTAGGGCKDTRTGLVWSKKSSSTMSWYAALWNEAYAGNAGSQESSDYGRTSDCDPDIPSGACADSDSIDYCHDLTEGGQSDWRLPTYNELLTLAGHITSAGNGPYLNGEANEWIWSNYGYYGGGYTSANVVNLTTAAASYSIKSSLNSVFCVRADASEAQQLARTSNGPASIGVSDTQIFSRPGVGPIVIQIQDALGNNRPVEGIPVTLSPSQGNISGDFTVLTDILGQAQFDNFMLDTTGQITLTASAPGLTSVSWTIRVGSFPHTCAVEDGEFQTADGGCKQMSTNLVWSLASSSTMTWYQAIWGYDDPEQPGFNAGDPPDADDGGRKNDYADGLYYSYPDLSITNYCHQLNEGGKTDWRVPTASELSTVTGSGMGAALHFPFDSNFYYWSSNTASWNGGSAQVTNLNSGSFIYPSKTNNHYAICVRP